METLTSILRDLRPGMWMVSRSEGCIPSCTYPSFISQVPEVRVEGPVWSPPRLPVGSPPLRRSHSTSSFYKVAGSSGGPLALQDFVYVPVFHAQHSKDQVLVTRNASIRLHLQLGFILNLAKSSLVPSQVMMHLGADIDTLVGVVRPTPDKIREISHVLQAFCWTSELPQTRSERSPTSCRLCWTSELPQPSTVNRL